jgi:hypothetical protein
MFSRRDFIEAIKEGRKAANDFEISSKLKRFSNSGSSLRAWDMRCNVVTLIRK